jgi:mRNA interferase YafQ
MKYQIEISTKFKKDYKKAVRRGCDISLLEQTITILADYGELPQKYKDHSLTGNYTGYRECHITPDWLLVYKIAEDILVLALTRTGSHSDIFSK